MTKKTPKNKTKKLSKENLIAILIGLSFLLFMEIIGFVAWFMRDMWLD